jgi:hypothetical protein
LPLAAAWGWAVAWPAPALAEPAVPSLSTEHPIKLGERFTYALTWLNIRAGTAVLEVAGAPAVQGQPTLRLLTSATSSPLVTKFYPVDNRVESLVDAEKLFPYRMQFRRREGKRNNDFDVTFDQAKGVIVSIKDGITEQFPLPPRTYDSISCLYYVRTLPALVPGATVAFNVHHDKKMYRLEIRVEAIETLRGPWGEVETVRVLAGADEGQGENRVRRGQPDRGISSARGSVSPEFFACSRASVHCPLGGKPI